MYDVEDVVVVAGYECPFSTSPQTKRMLRRLKRDGVLIFTCDDGPSSITRDELSEIAGAIGLECYDAPYRVAIVDDNQWKPIDGATNLREDDYPG